jgi:hypothetical protein
MSPFQQFKRFLVENVGLAKDGLHIYIGLILFFGSMLLMRWPARSFRPWLVALAGAVTGEMIDLSEDIAFHRFVYLPANWHDIWNTMFWPTVIFMLARWTRVFAAGR